MDTSLPTAFLISPLEFSRCIGASDSPLLLDVRREAGFCASDRIFAAAQRCPPEEALAFARSRPPQAAVVYCVYGHAVSAGVVATLREAGWDAQLLQGGFEGGEEGADHANAVALWKSTRPVSIRKRPDLGVTGESASRWITRARPKIDRVACPWLIRRFIDPRAQFFYVPADQVLAEAERLGAVAYDIPGAPITHEGELCSFDALLQAFDLRLPALDVLARVVRGADTSQPELAPQSSGLLALSLGLSLLHADDDTMLAAAMPMYDALFAWCRDGQAERHAWTASSAVETSR